MSPAAAPEVRVVGCEICGRPIEFSALFPATIEVSCLLDAQGRRLNILLSRSDFEALRRVFEQGAAAMTTEIQRKEGA